MRRLVPAFLGAVLGAALFMAAPAAAQENRFAVGLYGGTLGLGGDVQFGLSDRLVLRGGGHWLDFGIDGDYDDIDYDADIVGSNAFATIDLHPFANGWFVSGGLVIGPKRVDLNAAPTEPVEIGDVVFTPDQVGVLTGRGEARDVAPFVGLGWDNAITSGNRVGFSVLLGAAFTGDPEVELDAQGGTFSDEPLFREQLAIEEENLRDDLDDLPFYPVARIGVTLSF